jgi:glycosyltransferase involved in cell wall biosynthesis
MDISVVVCTYNRADLLREVLRDLCNQDYPKSQYEILVVDNNSIDNTRNIIEDLQTISDVRYILETHQGHTYARNRDGLRQKEAMWGMLMMIVNFLRSG